MTARGAGRALLASLALALAGAAAAFAQEDADCLRCHGDPAAKPAKEGEKAPPQVEVAALKASPHGKQQCTFCHQDLDGTKFPHEKPGPVDCATCHEKEGESHAKSLHGQALAKGDKMAPYCFDCHGGHDVKSPKDPTSPTNHMNIPQTCGRCHHEGSPVSRSHAIPQDRILENYSEGMHGEGLYKKGLAVTAVCTTCHTSHDILPHDDPRSSIHRDNIVKTCLTCHATIEQVHRKVIEGRLWESEPHKIPACVDCHQPHKMRKLSYPTVVANKDCLTSECHGRKDLATQRDGKSLSLYVDETSYLASTHTRVGCAQCHSDVDPSHTRPCETVRKKVDCSACHAEVVATYRSSIHGTLHDKGDPDAPVCLDCHSKHATQSRKTPSSPTYARNVPALCARCHREGEKAAIRISADVKDIVGAYTESIHGKGLVESGLVVTANCVSCHSAHGELPPSDPKSTVHKSNIAATCGRCHSGIEATLKTSIHWAGNGAPEDATLPTCNDCHTSHTIRRTGEAAFRFRVLEQCGNCHKKEAETYFDTFHGKVSRLGSSAAAKCFDCHGTHGILPPSNPASTLSHDNVVQTCAKCHHDAHRRFAGYLTHATHHDPETYPWLFWTFWGMTALLVGTLTFGLIHTGGWLVRLWMTRADWGPHRAAALAAGRAGEAKQYRRFDRFQRMQHLFMLLSFFTLALTGMTLKFSYAGWAGVVSDILGGFATMHVLHRIAALMLVTVFVVHLVSVNRRRRESGRTWRQFIFSPDSLMLGRQDWTDFVASIRWFFGIGPRPRYGRYTYWEKFDYFAVFWGVFIIGSTGLVLWFPELLTRVLPGAAINVATIIHSDEALLAVAFIFTVHFFNTHFRPDKFPMDPVIFTGRVTLEELKYDKPREYEELVAKGTLESHLVQPFAKPVERGFRIFGFIALAVGLTLVGLILYAMLFQYR